MRMVILGANWNLGKAGSPLTIQRVSGNTESASAPAATKTGMNLEEIKAGFFSSVAEFGK